MSNATYDAGISAASFLTRDAAGCWPNCSWASMGSKGGRTGKATARTVARSAGPRRPSGTRSDQAAIGGPARQLVTARELQLAQHRRHVGLDGLHGDPEVARHLLVRVPAG